MIVWEEIMYAVVGKLIYLIQLYIRILKQNITEKLQMERTLIKYKMVEEEEDPEK